MVIIFFCVEDEDIFFHLFVQGLAFRGTFVVPVTQGKPLRLQSIVLCHVVAIYYLLMICGIIVILRC